MSCRTVMTAFESGPGNDAALPKDATDREPVKRLVDRAVEQHDRIDAIPSCQPASELP